MSFCGDCSAFSAILALISHPFEAVGPGRRKGGALAPPKPGRSTLFLSRLPRSLRPQAAREARERKNQRTLQRQG
jgi:hypothetical protein